MGAPDASRVDNRAIDAAHDAAHADHALGIFQHQPEGARYRFGLEERVGVHADEVGALGEVDAGVDRVGFSPIDFVDHHHAGFDGGNIDAPDGLGGEAAAGAD